MYICDERVGMVVVYKGPQKGCLAGESFIFRANGKRGKNGWEVNRFKVFIAELVCWFANEFDL